MALGRWNAGASSAWNRLRTALRRDHPGAQFMRVVEVQKRGALHLHILVWVPAGDHLDVLRVQDQGQAAGFGCVLDLVTVEPGSRRHAYYVSKYVTKAADARADVPWTIDQVDEDTGEITALHTFARYRTWSTSRGWGLTMAQVRAVAAAARLTLAAQTRAAAGDALPPAAAGGRLSLGDLVGPSPPSL